jgi:uncharacterized protein (TIGR02118 family)
MVRMSVMYPRGEGKKFDLDYYAKKHMPLVQARWGGMGLVRYEIDKGLAGGAPGSPAPFVCIAQIYFDNTGNLQKAVAAHGKELFADVPNFTDITPQVQISEIVA